MNDDVNYDVYALDTSASDIVVSQGLGQGGVTLEVLEGEDASAVGEETAIVDPSAEARSSQLSVMESQARRLCGGHELAKNLMVAVEAEGIYVREASGREFLDCASGTVDQPLGHRHPALVEAMKRQIATRRTSARSSGLLPGTPCAHPSAMLRTYSAVFLLLVAAATGCPSKSDMTGSTAEASSDSSGSTTSASTNTSESSGPVVVTTGSESETGPCVGPGEPAGHCCSNNSINGVCCVNFGDACEPGQCCFGECDPVTGTCPVPPSCGVLGEACGDQECCGKLACAAEVCVLTCAVIGESCIEKACCKGLTCDGESSTCIATEECADVREYCDEETGGQQPCCDGVLLACNPDSAECEEQPR